jgi:Protein of unknown function (DUF3147)
VNAFILDLTASFVVGGAWVTLASVAAQHFGGKVGGFIAGLPATAALAIFFITYTEGARHGFDVTGLFPLAISVNAVFLAAFAAFSRKSFSGGLLTGLIIWVLVQSVLLHFHPVGFRVVVILGVMLFVGSLLFVSRLDTLDPGARPVRHGRVEIAIRAGCGGGIIVLATIGSRFGGPDLGGILSAFPATTIATLIITNIYGGRALTRVMVRPMMVSGVVNCMVFALMYRHVVLHMQVFGALASAYAVTLVSAAGTFYWMTIYHREHAHAIHT